MSTPDPIAVTPAIPWYQSRVQIAQVTALVSAAIAMFPKLGTLLGLSNLAAIQTAVEVIFGSIALIAPAIGAIWRAHSPLQPLTLTKASAAVHPATVAASTSPLGVLNAQRPASPPAAPPSGPNDKPGT